MPCVYDDVPGSWRGQSEGWPSIHDPDHAVRRLVIAEDLVPLGSYVTVGDELRLETQAHVARVRAAMPTPPASVSDPVAGVVGVERLSMQYRTHPGSSTGEINIRLNPAPSGEIVRYADHARIVADLRAHTAEVVADAVRLREIRHEQWTKLQVAEQRAEAMAGLLREWLAWICGPTSLHDRTNAALTGQTTPEGSS